MRGWSHRDLDPEDPPRRSRTGRFLHSSPAPDELEQVKLRHLIAESCIIPATSPRNLLAQATRPLVWIILAWRGGPDVTRTQLPCRSFLVLQKACFADGKFEQRCSAVATGSGTLLPLGRARAKPRNRGENEGSGRRFLDQGAPPGDRRLARMCDPAQSTGRLQVGSLHTLRP